jgi:hypothetical protein
MNATAVQILVAEVAKTIGITKKAYNSMADFLALNTGHPFFISQPERYPPPILPMVLAVYTTTSGRLGFLRSKSKIWAK